MKKRGISILVALAMMFTFVSVSAERNIKIYVDGIELECDSPAFIENGNTMVPMRNIFEHLNAKVDWDNDTKTITAKKEDTEITLQIGSQTLKKNEKSEQLDVTPVIVNDTTFVPIRAVSQALDANVVWDDKTSTIKISSDSSAASSDNEPTVTMYAPDGRTIDVAQSEVEAYENVGWYTESVVLMYAADGRTRYTLQSEVEAYQGVGWYTEPVVLMYAADGRTRYTLQSEVEAYEKVGWYREPVVLMYAADGRTRYTLKSEVDAYKKVGWYTEPYTPPKTNSSSSGSSSGGSSSSGVVRGSTVYVTPSGKKYHYSASCAGKNARATTLSAAQASGKGPCAKCAR